MPTEMSIHPITAEDILGVLSRTRSPKKWLFDALNSGL
jgi:hypothetical protein